jgi:hypothetical protein
VTGVQTCALPICNINSFILRITVSSLHTTDQIEDLMALLEKWRRKHGSDKD